MVKKLRYYARFIVVCLLLNKMDVVKDLVKVCCNQDKGAEGWEVADPCFSSLSDIQHREYLLSFRHLIMTLQDQMIWLHCLNEQQVKVFQ